jgi:hypothetical protein
MKSKLLLEKLLLLRQQPESLTAGDVSSKFEQFGWEAESSEDESPQEIIARRARELTANAKQFALDSSEYEALDGMGGSVRLLVFSQLKDGLDETIDKNDDEIITVAEAKGFMSRLEATFKSQFLTPAGLFSKSGIAEFAEYGEGAQEYERGELARWEDAFLHPVRWLSEKASDQFAAIRSDLEGAIGSGTFTEAGLIRLTIELGLAPDEAEAKKMMTDTYDQRVFSTDFSKVAFAILYQGIKMGAESAELLFDGLAQIPKIIVDAAILAKLQAMKTLKRDPGEIMGMEMQIQGHLEQSPLLKAIFDRGYEAKDIANLTVGQLMNVLGIIAPMAASKVAGRFSKSARSGASSVADDAARAADKAAEVTDDAAGALDDASKQTELAESTGDAADNAASSTRDAGPDSASHQGTIDSAIIDQLPNGYTIADLDQLANKIKQRIREIHPDVTGMSATDELLELNRQLNELKRMRQRMVGARVTTPDTITETPDTITQDAGVAPEARAEVIELDNYRDAAGDVAYRADEVRTAAGDGTVGDGARGAGSPPRRQSGGDGGGDVDSPSREAPAGDPDNVVDARERFGSNNRSAAEQVYSDRVRAAKAQYQERIKLAEITENSASKRPDTPNGRKMASRDREMARKLRRQAQDDFDLEMRNAKAQLDENPGRPGEQSRQSADDFDRASYFDGQEFADGDTVFLAEEGRVITGKVEGLTPDGELLIRIIDENDPNFRGGSSVSVPRDRLDRLSHSRRDVAEILAKETIESAEARLAEQARKMESDYHRKLEQADRHVVEAEALEGKGLMRDKGVKTAREEAARLRENAKEVYDLEMQRVQSQLDDALREADLHRSHGVEPDLDAMIQEVIANKPQAKARITELQSKIDKIRNGRNLSELDDAAIRELRAMNDEIGQLRSRYVIDDPAIAKLDAEFRIHDLEKTMFDEMGARGWDELTPDEIARMEDLNQQIADLRREHGLASRAAAEAESAAGRLSRPVKTKIIALAKAAKDRLSRMNPAEAMRDFINKVRFNPGLIGLRHAVNSVPPRVLIPANMIYINTLFPDEAISEEDVAKVVEARTAPASRASESEPTFAERLKALSFSEIIAQNKGEFRELIKEHKDNYQPGGWKKINIEAAKIVFNNDDYNFNNDEQSTEFGEKFQKFLDDKIENARHILEYTDREGQTQVIDGKVGKKTLTVLEQYLDNL